MGAFTRRIYHENFLKSTMPRLLRGGVLTFVIPQHILRLVEIARYLASQYVGLTVLRFPDGEYERFKQVLLLATRREKGHLAMLMPLDMTSAEEYIP